MSITFQATKRQPSWKATTPDPWFSVLKTPVKYDYVDFNYNLNFYVHLSLVNIFNMINSTFIKYLYLQSLSDLKCPPCLREKALIADLFMENYQITLNTHWIAFNLAGLIVSRS